MIGQVMNKEVKEQMDEWVKKWINEFIKEKIVQLRNLQTVYTGDVQK